MKTKVKKYKDESPIDYLVLRDKLGFKRYRKAVKRDEEERKILIDLALQKMEEKEKDDFIVVGFRRRKIKII